jgi:hypothetical protein
MVGSVRSLVRAATAAAFLCAATGASAQLLLSKSVDPEGHVAHTDRTESAPLPDSSHEPEAPQPRRSVVPSRRGAQVNASEAKRRLAQAELKRKLGEAPLPGERAQVAGGIVVNYRYWQRQEKLRIEVEHAQRRVNSTNRTALR